MARNRLMLVLARKKYFFFFCAILAVVLGAMAWSFRGAGSGEPAVRKPAAGAPAPGQN